METRLKKEDSLALKGIGILLMIFHHCYRSTEKYSGYNIVFAPFQEMLVVNYGMYAKICVSIFVFVSGYGLMSGYSRLMQTANVNAQKVTAWTEKHIISTMQGYWFVAPMSYLFYGIFNGFQFSKWGSGPCEKMLYIFFDCVGLSGILDTKSLNGTWWYIGTAVIFVAAVPVLSWIVDKFGAIECIIFVFVLPRMLQLGFLGGRNAYSFLMMLLIGMLCYKYDFIAKFESWKLLKNTHLNQIGKFMLIVILVYCGILSSERIKIGLLWEYKYAVIPFIVILFCVEYVFKIPFCKEILTFLGKHSGNIWLIHTFVRDWLGNYIWSTKYFWIIPLIILAVSLGISFIIEFCKWVIGYDFWFQKIVQHMK